MREQQSESSGETSFFAAFCLCVSHRADGVRMSSCVFLVNHRSDYIIDSRF